MIVIYLILCFRYDASTEFGAIMGIDFLCISVLRVASGGTKGEDSRLKRKFHYSSQ